MIFKYMCILLLSVPLFSSTKRYKESSDCFLEKETRRLEKVVVKDLKKSNYSMSDDLSFYHIYECEFFEKDSFSLPNVKYKFHKKKRILKGMTVICDKHLPVASYYNNTLFCYSNYNDDFSKDEIELIDFMVIHKPRLVLTFKYERFYFVYGQEIKEVEKRDGKYVFCDKCR